MDKPRHAHHPQRRRSPASARRRAAPSPRGCIAIPVSRARIHAGAPRRAALRRVKPATLVISSHPGSAPQPVDAQTTNEERTHLPTHPTTTRALRAVEEGRLAVPCPVPTTRVLRRGPALPQIPASVELLIVYPCTAAEYAYTPSLPATSRAVRCATPARAHARPRPYTRPI